jgi:hypothetical protein
MASARHQSRQKPRTTCQPAGCHRDWRSARAPARCGWLRRRGCRPPISLRKCLARTRDGGHGDLFSHLHSRSEALGDEKLDQDLAAIVDAGDLGLTGDIVAGIDRKNAERSTDRRRYGAARQFKLGLPESDTGRVISVVRLIGLHARSGAARHQAFKPGDTGLGVIDGQSGALDGEFFLRRVEMNDHIAALDPPAGLDRNPVDLAGHQRAHRHRADRLAGANRGQPVIDHALAGFRHDDQGLARSARPALAAGALTLRLPGGSRIRLGRKQRNTLKSITAQNAVSTGIKPRPSHKRQGEQGNRQKKLFPELQIREFPRDRQRPVLYDAYGRSRHSDVVRYPSTRQFTRQWLFTQRAVRERHLLCRRKFELRNSYFFSFMKCRGGFPVPHRTSNLSTLPPRPPN